ncbi:TPA: hypothetical protein ACGG3U_001004 [Legionella pneumophila]|nr:hypothetical protein [Legionella pneumophila]WBV63574.1 hypothetical protein PGH43_01590 [Legionella pneumophila 130b]AGH52615.1 hypothetical protein LPE509_00524 [Legionella pneumophila subsp. pneumophila LPE509]MCW8390421.1 hypothetical protein [Legionella pneumophila]MCW8438745.1 hypothetical protein [Legionella pneumophila]MCW8481166.1 hypothetical protein [Legionella pneumophila]
MKTPLSVLQCKGAVFAEVWEKQHRQIDFAFLSSGDLIGEEAK